DEERRDELESSALYDLLERAVAPKFYDRKEHGVPPRWIEMVRHTVQTLGPKVLASRMVRDYVQQYYTPAAESLRCLTAPARKQTSSALRGSCPLTSDASKQRGRSSKSPTSTAPACRIRR